MSIEVSGDAVSAAVAGDDSRAIWPEVGRHDGGRIGQQRLAN